MCFDEVNDFASRGARREDLSDASLFQSWDIALRDDAAADDEGIFEALLTDEVDNSWEEMWMSTGKNAHCDNINVFLDSSLSYLLRSLTKTGVDNLKACIAKCTCDDFSAAIMAIKTWFCN